MIGPKIICKKCYIERAGCIPILFLYQKNIYVATLMKRGHEFENKQEGGYIGRYGESKTKGNDVTIL